MIRRGTSPKVTVVGAGSLFFGRQAIWQMVASKHLNEGTLALVDTDPKRLNTLKTVAEKVIAEAGVPLKLETSGNWQDCFTRLGLCRVELRA